MPEEHIDVIATTISGSISDWAKVGRIVPLFRTCGLRDVDLHVVDTHGAARDLTRCQVRSGTRTVIAAGGSGTFNSVIEGCIDAAVPLSDLTLGFLRKGSADLLGKALGMPDEITCAIEVIAESLARRRTVPCDVIGVRQGRDPGHARHFVGYAGAEIFGRIPHYTENRFIKYYKGLLGQFFGDLGPFFVGASLAVLEKSWRSLVQSPVPWEVYIDGQVVAVNVYQAMIILNGDLGPDLPFARSVALGSGDFHLFAFRDLGALRLLAQFRNAWNVSVLDRAERFGLEHYRVGRILRLRPRSDRPFPVNVDGSTMSCAPWVDFSIIDQVRLLSAHVAPAAI